MKTKDVRTVGFDAWGTLVHYASARTSAEKAYLSQPLLDALKSKMPIEQTADQFYAQYREIGQSAERLSEITGKHIGARSRHAMLFLAFGITPDILNSDPDLQAASQEHIRRAETMYPQLIEPGTPDVFNKLRVRGIKTAIVSNLGSVGAGFMRTAFTRLGMAEAFDYELYSDETGLCKPNPRVFERLSRVSGTPPENILFIGDNYRADYEGPIKVGMNAVHLSQGDSPAANHAINVSGALRLADILD